MLLWKTLPDDLSPPTRSLVIYTDTTTDQAWGSDWLIWPVLWLLGGWVWLDLCAIWKMTHCTSGVTMTQHTRSYNDTTHTRSYSDTTHWKLQWHSRHQGLQWHNRHQGLQWHNTTGVAVTYNILGITEGNLVQQVTAGLSYCGSISWWSSCKVSLIF